MEELIKRLKDLYPDVKFAEEKLNSGNILLYDDRKLIWDNEFNDKVLELSEKYLNEDDYNSFAYIYDWDC